MIGQDVLDGLEIVSRRAKPQRVALDDDIPLADALCVVFDQAGQGDWIRGVQSHIGKPLLAHLLIQVMRKRLLACYILSPYDRVTQQERVILGRGEARKSIV